MAKYTIKDNLPREEHDLLERRYGSFQDICTAAARNMFLRILEHLHGRPSVDIVSVNFRNEKGMPLRGTIQVRIGGFFYYVELFKV